MSDLNSYREEIDRIDREIQKLFEERMDVSTKIGEYKASRGMPVFDAVREDMLIRKLRAGAGDADLADGIEELYRTLLKVSRARQEKILNLHKKQ